MSAAIVKDQKILWTEFVALRKVGDVGGCDRRFEEL